MGCGFDVLFGGGHSGARVLSFGLFGCWATGGISSYWFHAGYIKEAEIGAERIDHRRNCAI
jgi:hypothetical protein